METTTRRPSPESVRMLGVASLATAAHAYVALGWPTFLCRPGEKRPLGTRGLDSATTDRDVLDRWLRASPGANLAVRTGVGFDVLDVDTKRDGMASLPRLRDAGLLRGAWALASTPSGGLHLYLPVSGDGNHTSRFGVDYRGRRGYVLVPPSRIEEGGYRWEEADDSRQGPPLDWARAMALLDPPRPRARAAEEAGSPDALVAYVSRLAKGNRNAGLYWAACRAVDEGHDPALLADVALSTGLTEREVFATIHSAARRRP